MVLFHLINPNAMAPYAAELEGGPHKKALEEVKLKMLQGKLPNQLPNTLKSVQQNGSLLLVHLHMLCICTSNTSKC